MVNLTICVSSIQIKSGEKRETSVIAVFFCFSKVQTLCNRIYTCIFLCLMSSNPNIHNVVTFHLQWPHKYICSVETRQTHIIWGENSPHLFALLAYVDTMIPMCLLWCFICFFDCMMNIFSHVPTIFAKFNLFVCLQLR